MARDAHVVGIARDFSSVDESQMEKLELDLGDLQSLSECLANEPMLQRDFQVIVLNAGYGLFGGLENFSQQQIRHLLDVNLVSNLFLLKHFLPKLKAQDSADIVFIGSESALRGGKQGSVYCASKFAIRGLVQSLQHDCSGTDIRCMLINPGPVATDFFDDLGFVPEAGDDYALDADTVADALLNALDQPRNAVTTEINLQPVKRAFRKK